jgi:hypothetical protein
MKYKNHDISHDVMISYMDVVLKTLGRFHTFVHVQCLQTKASHKIILNVEKDLIKLKSKQWSNYDLTTKLFV